MEPGSSLSEDMSSNIETKLCLDKSICMALPPELMDIVFDALRRVDDRKEALFASSLVCHTWRELTLRHRFHSLVFYAIPKPKCERPLSSLLQDFFESDTFNRTRHSVRALTLSWRRNRIDPGFARSVNYFPSLETLKLKGHISSLVDTSVLHEALVPNIRTLTIRGQQQRIGGRRHFTSSLCDLLCQFTSLDTLRLLDIVETSAEDDTDRLNRPLPRIGSLFLRNIDLGAPIASVVKELANRYPLKRLDLLTYTGEELQETLDEVKRFDVTPEHIRFSLTCWGKEMHGAWFCWRHCGFNFNNEHASAVNLSSLRAMKRLTIAIEVDTCDAATDDLQAGSFNSNNVPWTEATETLSTLDPHSRLDFIAIYIGPADLDLDDPEPSLAQMLDTLGALDPSVLRGFEDAVLCLAREERLGHIDISLYRAISTEVGLDPRFFYPSEDYLRALFPALDEAGVLHV